PLNFGWGRNRVDGKSREGTFVIDALGNSSAKVLPGELSLVEPVAEFGREHSEPIAVSGPVRSDTFSRIALLFGDLVSGRLFATIGPPALKRQEVLRVAIVDGNGQLVTLKSMTKNERPDPRFFNFPDGSAGVLLERTGEFYRVSEVR